MDRKRAARLALFDRSLRAIDANVSSLNTELMEDTGGIQTALRRHPAVEQSMRMVKQAISQLLSGVRQSGIPHDGDVSVEALSEALHADPEAAEAFRRLSTSLRAIADIIDTVASAKPNARPSLDDDLRRYLQQSERPSGTKVSGVRRIQRADDDIAAPPDAEELEELRQRIKTLPPPERKSLVTELMGFVKGRRR